MHSALCEDQHCLGEHNKLSDMCVIWTGAADVVLVGHRWAGMETRSYSWHSGQIVLMKSV